MSFVDRLTRQLARWSGRPTLFAVAVMNLITGFAFGALHAPLIYGADSSQFRSCALGLAEGQADFCGSLYSPLTALVARPLTWVSPTTAMIAMTLLGLAILTIGVSLETRGQAAVDRVLVFVAVVGFAPVVYELLLGQTTLLIAAAIYPLVRRPDAFRSGIPLGIVLALAPKPLLLPFLAWMLVWRRRGLTSAVLTALALTGVGIVAVGIGQYGEWVSILTGAGRQTVAGTFSLSLRINASLWPLDPASLVLAIVVAGATLWAILRDTTRGFVASLLAGLLLAPYSLIYAFSILLLAVKPALVFAPRATRVLALTVNLAGAIFLAMTAWSLAGLIAVVPIRFRGDRPAVTGK